MKFKKLIPVLTRAKVDFILIGGVAGIVHGAARVTYDLDIVYSRKPENLKRLSKALMPYSPYLRGAPPGLPFRLDLVTLKSGLNFTLTTDLGDIDLFGEIPRGGTYEDLLPFSEEITVFGHKCFCVTLEKLIEIKKATGRPKDLEALAELQRLWEDQKKDLSED